VREGARSATAERAALMRAVHHRRDRPRVLDDSIAIRLLDAATGATVEAEPERYETVPLRRLRATVALRGRYAEDRLRDAMEHGIRQYVILGAGLDTFAYRSPLARSSLRVFEVDHPGTQVWKRERLREAGIQPPDSVTFVSVDFEREPLVEALAGGGLDPNVPTFVSWLGVSVYLTSQAIRQTLAALASLGAGSVVVFDYVVPPSSLAEPARPARVRMAARAATAGEPWVTFFEPPMIAAELGAAGLAVVEDLAPGQAIELLPRPERRAPSRKRGAPRVRDGRSERGYPPRCVNAARASMNQTASVATR
jgi:methyltransferase (TIGR00027 family)